MYMDKRGETVKTTANREHAFMSKVFQWGYERGLVIANPCRVLKIFPEDGRDHYVSDEEYNLGYRFANTKFGAVMEIAYLCAARALDMLKFERKDMMVEKYDRKVKKVKTLDLPEIEEK